jgi:hypothetical protein
VAAPLAKLLADDTLTNKEKQIITKSKNGLRVFNQIRFAEDDTYSSNWVAEAGAQKIAAEQATNGTRAELERMLAPKVLRPAVAAAQRTVAESGMAVANAKHGTDAKLGVQLTGEGGKTQDAEILQVTGVTKQGMQVKVKGSDEDRGLLNSLGGNAKEMWQTAGGGYTFKVLDAKRVTILMDSPEMAKAYGSGLVAARFRYEDGQVIHVTGHFFTQPGQQPNANVAQAGKGFTQFLEILDGGRISVAAMGVGLAQGAYDLAYAYAQEREQFGKPIAKFQAIQFQLADMAVELEAGRALTYKAAWLKDQGRPFAKEAAMAKLYTGELSHRAANAALQIHGGYGFMDEFPISRLYRDQKILEIGEGTNEVQRMVIARHLGLPPS